MDLRITDCSENEIDLIYKGISESNLRKLPGLCGGEKQEINKKISDGNGTVIAGCLAEINQWNVLHVGILWVSDEYQKRGLGSKLLKAVEAIAAENGCTLAHLSTFDFQAKDFYIKNGYEVFGVLDGFPEGHCRYYLKKTLK